MELRDTGLKSLLSTIDASKKEPTYTDPATGEILAKNGLSLTNDQASDVGGAVILPFPLHRVLGE